jgi:phosphoenolpyruvate carboxykinase (GTP)
MAELLGVDADEWKAQLPQFREHLAKFARLPSELHKQLESLAERLG